MLFSFTAYWAIVFPGLLTGIILMRKLQQARDQAAVTAPIPVPINDKE